MAIIHPAVGPLEDKPNDTSYTIIAQTIERNLKQMIMIMRSVLM
jgi:hypothetical protein